MEMESNPNFTSSSSNASSLNFDSTSSNTSIRDASINEVDPAIPIKQEKPEQVEIDEETESADQKRPVKRTLRALARTRNFFRRLFIKRRAQSRVECRKCGHRLNLSMSPGRRNVAYCLPMFSIRRHIIAHVDKPMYSCLHCGQTCKSLCQIRDHAQKLHNRPLDYSDLSDSYEKEIFKMAEECFGEKSCEGEGDSPIKIRYAITQYFTRIYLANWRNSSRMICNLCGVELSVRNIKSKKNHAISHAAIHLEKFLFSCLHCSYQSVTHFAMIRHLRNRHVLGGHQENYINRMHEFKEELCAIFERCYSKRKGAKKQSKIQDPETIRAENIIRALGGQNTIFTERQLHCRRLLVKFAKAGSIKCRVCSHLVNVQQHGALSNQHAIWHASTHMDKPLYKCKKCDKDIHVMSSVYRHMKKEHGITKGVTKEFEDRSSELHKEILNALTRSFDWTGEDWRADDSSEEDRSDDDWSVEM